MRARLFYCLSIVLFTAATPTTAEIIHRNPRPYNVDYTFELCPDPNVVDRSKDLKLWIPVPREWASQKAVKIVSAEPKPHAEYTDPEHGNRMFFWDFGKTPEKPSYEVRLRYRLESYEIHAEIDLNRVGAYDKTSDAYKLYTRSTHTVRITPQIKEMAQVAVGDETNPYLQAKRIFDFVRKKMRFKILDYERGRGINCLLEHPAKDKKTGEEYYEGCCNQYSVFFCALCRATGIPARAVSGFIGGLPWITEEQLKPLYEFETKLSPDGLAGVQHFGNMWPHMWAEFCVPGYGWVIADAWAGRFCHLDNGKVILNKGRDVEIDPHAPQEQNAGYGSQWVLLHDGRADHLFSAVWNIASVHSAKVKVLHRPDPFPAHALTRYMSNLYPPDNAEQECVSYREDALTQVQDAVRSNTGETLWLDAYKKNPRLRYRLEPFICHMLREVVGDKHFFDIYETYVDRRLHSGKPISTERFQEIAETVHGKPLDWFWDQWLELRTLPQLKLHDVRASEASEGWRVRGSLSQVCNSLFRLPVELELRTDKGTERRRLWLEKKRATFEFHTSHHPKQVLVDPDGDILKIQEMPASLNKLRNFYPHYAVVYGTAKEMESNKAAAQRFSRDFLQLDEKIITPDVDANDADLKDKCIIVFGRPETNAITERFKDALPIPFDGNRFSWQGRTYGEATQGVIEVIEHPDDPKQLIILFAGVSGEATRRLSRLRLSDGRASYVIFDADKELARGCWPADENLVWTFEQ